MNIEDIKTLFHLLKLNNTTAVIEDTIKKEEDKTPEVKPEKKYEDKYLEKIRGLSEEYIFNEDETLLEEELFIKFYNDAVNSLKNEKEELKDRLIVLQQELSDIENIEFSEEDKNPSYDADGDEVEPFEERIREKTRLFSEEVDTIKEKLIHLDEKVVSEEEIKEDVRNHIINQRLDKLKNNFIIEKTPLGNVLMFYNNKKESFEYYSDNSMPYRFLEVVGRKYVLTFNCRFLYVDMEKELEKYEKKLKDEKEKQEKEKENEKEEIPEILSSDTKTTPKKNVFAKFKSYNKDAGSGRVNKAPPPKNSIPNNKVVKNDNEPVLLKEKANHYTYEGKFANFNILKKVSRKNVDKKYSLTFADFKKNIINKNKN